MKKRMFYIDSLRGFLTLLVIFGHVCVGLQNSKLYHGTQQEILRTIVRVIYAFHMPAFFSLSGFLYYGKKIASAKELKQSVVHRLMVLGIPYLLCSAAYWLVKYVMSFAVDKPLSLMDFIQIPVKPIEFFWYLYALLLIYLLADIFHFLNVNKKLLLLLFLAATLLLKPVGNLKSLNIISKTVIHVFYFYLGYFMGEFLPYIKKKSCIVTTGMLFTFMIFLFIMRPNIIFETAAAVSVCIFLVGLFHELFDKPSRISSVGNTAMPYYILHVIFVGGIRIVLIRLGITNIWIHVLAGFFVSFLICYAAYHFVIKKVPWLDFFFYPGKYIGNK